MISVVCAWCNREMFKDKLSGTTSMGGIVPQEKQIPGTISHGICQDCMKDMMKQSGLQQDTPPAAAHESFRDWVERRQSSKGE